MKPPIFNLIMKYVAKQRIKFCTPGHKGKIRMKTDNLCRIDIENIPSGDNLNVSDSILQSQEEVAGIFASSKSYYLTGGIDAGIYATLASLCNPGDKVIVDPECGQAIINAITILALQPVFLKRSYCNKYSINGGISTEKIESVTNAHSDAKLVIITSPSYYGICANIRKIVSVAHEKDMLVLVDESYGAHFAFSKDLPETALESGADIVVQSLSKTLGGFSGCALLHLGHTIEFNMQSTIEANLDIYQGGSKSTSMLCAAENIIFYAFTNSTKYNAILKEIERGKDIIEQRTNLTWFDVEYDNECDISLTDITKIVFNFSELNIDASEAYDIFTNKYGIEPDFADENNLVFSVSLYNTPSEIRKLINSCLALDKLVNPIDEPEDTEEEFVTELFDAGPKIVMSPYKAFYSSSEMVDIDDSVGKICKRVICKFPQGTPIIIPGEKISQEQVETIKSLINRGAKVHGLNGKRLIEVLTLSDSFYF